MSTAASPAPSASPDGVYPPTGRTTATQHRDRMRYGVAEVHDILDQAVIAHLGYVVDGEPVVLPTIHVRVADRIYLHASSGARIAQLARELGQVPVCLTVTLLDGLVLARSQFHHSLNYRSAVVRGELELVRDDAERQRALAAIVDHIVPGRSGASRPPTPRELAATAVLRLPLAEASAKVRTGAPRDDEADLGLPHWAGVVPVRQVFGPAEPDADLAPGTEVPEHVAAVVSG